MDLDPNNTMPRDSDGFIVLKHNYSDLWKKVNYRTTRTAVLDRVYEYDIRSANTSSMRASGKIDESLLDTLDSMKKQAREEAVGKMIRKDRKIWKIISNQIRHAREQLFRENLIQDDEVLAIKNDAVFIIGRKLKYTTFGPMEFRLKHQYSLYLLISKVEFYYDKRTRSIDIKGVKDEVVNEPDHQEGMMKFFDQVFYYLAMDRRDDLRKYLIKFTHDYKAKKLLHQYYREFNGENVYRTIMELAGFEYNLIEITDHDLDIINPVYNYLRFVLPILRQYL